MKLLSVVVPCYNEQETIPIFYNEICKVINNMEEYVDFEIVFVDDGSSDATLREIRDLHLKDEKVKYLSFTRNFGKESAMYAGIKKAQGDYIAIMDVDLQDPPKLLIDMYHGIVNEGFDCVATRRADRKGEPPVRSFFARLFYRLINKMSKTELVDGARDYRLMTRQMAEAIISMNEYNRFSKGIFSWVGFKTKWLSYENVKRVAGKTKWSFWKLLIYSMEGIVAFTTVPLSIASVAGLFFCLVSFLLTIIFVVKTLIWGDPVAGYPSLVCLITFIGGIQLFCIGILGHYLAKTYLETKNRPIYIVKEEDEKPLSMQREADRILRQ